ncbi:isoquinoline 1-oxidoreductase, beta subunit [Sphingobium sp. AP50]|uniref:xanthine dehydrogenase family protein molybdopterin-binding subunit n=1 Tax=Sphingobium sp. AP50 TaxID=1884369 RepID=UPI0008AD4FB7|nr:molybdopterin cofactor-binding domain-containing protein [Sphingobium sp. AP50]SEJ81525.1 isoquinoline 1-oxidoreductase, beta subunit [Sphingobium sp. AP50]
MSDFATSRRTFIRSSLALIPGSLILSVPLIASGADAEAGYKTAFLRITDKDEIILVSPVAELGQGTSTAYGMVLADSLDADWSRISIELAPRDDAYINPILGGQLTGASTGMAAFHPAFKKAGETARTMLLQAAAQRWRVPVTQVRTESGRVLGPQPGQDLRFGQLAVAASRLPVPAPDKIIARTDTRPRYQGKRLGRFDIPSKVNGSAIYAVDFKLPDMLYVAVAAAPVFGGRATADKRADVLRVKGVRGVVDLPHGVAIVADRWWTARRCLELLEIVWAETPHDNVSSQSITSQFERDLAAQDGIVVETRGEPVAGLKDADRVISQRYEVPYLAHATMEPMSCVAKVENGRCDIWLGSQQPANACAAAARVLGISETAVDYHPLVAGGGFGRRQEFDMVEQAVIAAKHFSPRPVKLIWTREEDVSHDFYRPAGISELKAGIKGSDISVYSHRTVSPSILPRMYPVAMGKFDSVVTDAVGSPYDFDHVDTRWVRSETHIPTGMWRTVGAGQTVFAIESFIDEVAHDLGVDEYELRRNLLAKKPRALAALAKLKEMVGGSFATRPNGRAIGLGVSHKWQDCFVAQAVEVVIRDGAPVVEAVYSVADPGKAINRDAVVAQIEGCVIWGMSSALYGKVSVANGAVQETNFHDYRMVRFSETPQFHTVIIDGGESIEGTGEGGSPNIAPAICNAIFKLTGKRIRKLPIMENFA